MVLPYYHKKYQGIKYAGRLLPDSRSLENLSTVPNNMNKIGREMEAWYAVHKLASSVLCGARRGLIIILIESEPEF